MRFTRAHAAALTWAAAAAGLASAGPLARWFTSIPPYAVSLSAEYDAVALLSAGDALPVTGDATRTWQMVGIPDGLGARANKKGDAIVFMNHELTQGQLSEPYVGEALNRGAFVSRVVLTPSGVALSARRAHDSVFVDDAFFGPAADSTNATPGFARLCSGSHVDSRDGFTTSIYLAGEESAGAGTFGGAGGQLVAFIDDGAHVLSALPNFAWENALAQPRSDDRTVILCMEDGPFDLDPARDNSQLYLYVGTRDRTPGATLLQQNGLVGGKVYVFRSVDAARNSEATFTAGTLEGEWVELVGAGAMSDVQVEAAADAAGAMTFARPEDAAFNPRNARNCFFVTTGGAKGQNELGRIYSLRLGKVPTGHALLTLVVNADAIVAAGGDTAISPDNVCCSDDYLMVCEDGTTESRLVMGAKGRDGSIWRFALTGTLGADPLSAQRVVELDPPGRDGVAVGPGIWETSGVIATDGLFGDGSFLFDVQAHRPTGTPAPNTVEDGQLLLLLKK